MWTDYYEGRNEKDGRGSGGGLFQDIILKFVWKVLGTPRNTSISRAGFRAEIRSKYTPTKTV